MRCCIYSNHSNRRDVINVRLLRDCLHGVCSININKNHDNTMNYELRRALVHGVGWLDNASQTC